MEKWYKEVLTVIHCDSENALVDSTLIPHVILFCTSIFVDQQIINIIVIAISRWLLMLIDILWLFGVANPLAVVAVDQWLQHVSSICTPSSPYLVYVDYPLVLLRSYGQWPFVVDVPIKDCDFP